MSELRGVAGRCDRRWEGQMNRCDPRLVLGVVVLACLASWIALPLRVVYGLALIWIFLCVFLIDNFLRSRNPEASRMSDSLTNPLTPRDQFGALIADGCWYRLVQRRRRAAYCQVCFDPDSGELLCLPRGAERAQRVDEMDPGVRWELIDESEVHPA